MNANFTAEATWGGKPLETLSAFVAKRMKILRENAYDSAVSTMINVLVSLRAQTRKAGPSTANKTKPAIVLQASYRVSYDPQAKRRCLRHLDKGSPVEHPKYRVRFICGDWRTWSAAKVFLVKPEHTRDKPYLIAAMSERDALNFEKRRVGHKINSNGGLARLAFSIAANRVSTRQTAAEKISIFGEVAANRLTKVDERINGQTFEISVRDSLEHAVPALKFGAYSIDEAYKAAANKTYGILAREVERFGLDENIGTTPFPEVKRVRKTA